MRRKFEEKQEAAEAFHRAAEEWLQSRPPGWTDRTYPFTAEDREYELM